MFQTIKNDIQTVFQRDPAARTWWEVVTCYPGLHALWLHRVAHWFWKAQHILIARLLAHFSRWMTGIEIHPGARIGKGFFIDHGSGVVIGETTIIKDNVTIYHQVTLGGTTLKKEKRHPTVEDNVVISVGAKVLGNIVIGHNSRIGAGSVVIRDVPPYSTVVGIPGKVVAINGRRLADGQVDLNHNILPDPMAHSIHCINEHIHSLHQEIETMKKEKIGRASCRERV